MKELGSYYKDSGKLKCLYLRGGVSECKRIEISLFNEMATIGISYLKNVLMNYDEVLSALQLREKLPALQLIQEPVP